jgi:hypothetical protein
MMVPPLNMLIHSHYGFSGPTVVVPLGELGFLKSSFFDVLGIGLIVDLELDWALTT